MAGLWSRLKLPQRETKTFPQSWPKNKPQAAHDFEFSMRLLAHLDNVRWPATQFFRPRPRFYHALAQFRERLILDAGAGVGHVTQSLLERQFRILALDNGRREGQWSGVFPGDARDIPYAPGMVLLACRPDHSGWFVEASRSALNAGAQVVYVGLARNLDWDLQELCGKQAQLWEDVGEDAEMLLVFEPGKSRCGELHKSIRRLRFGTRAPLEAVQAQPALKKTSP